MTASSDNMMAGVDTTWAAAFRPAFESSWMSEAFTRDTEALTKALQVSIAAGPSSSSFEASPAVSATVSAFSDLYTIVNNSETPSSQQRGCQSFTSSGGGGGGGGGSEPETAISKRVSRKPVTLPPQSGKITKRKSRASKRSPTTFITADPANFRQMVQQVTGVRFSSGPGLVGSVVKPEAHRPVGVVNRLQAGCHLPTLDTSAFLLDHHNNHQQVVVGPVAGAAQGSLRFGPPSVVAGSGSGGSGGGGGAGIDFDGFCNFPTLESWKVM